jgi:hypothetical protein
VTEAIRCFILEVMESWPLQLRCEAADGIWQVALADDTQVAGEEGASGSPGDLRPGMAVVVEGEPTGTRALLARRIKVL